MNIFCFHPCRRGAMPAWSALLPALTLSLSLLLAACQTTSTQPQAGISEPQPMVVPPPEVPSKAPTPTLRLSAWTDVDGWNNENLPATWHAFLTSCSALKAQPTWQPVCAAALELKDTSSAALRDFFEWNFTPYQIINGDGTDTGTITGYYEPLLYGSRTPSKRYPYPIYGVPDDLLTIDLGDIYPDFKTMRLRGRYDPNKKRIVAYYTRAQITGGLAPVAGKELVYVDDPIDLFFLQIQGSGRVKLDNGEVIRVGYADQNGYPYKSIGKRLVDTGELTLAQASMNGIKDWARRNPGKLQDLLNYDMSYVFFRLLPSNPNVGPIGALGVPLTAERSLAVDARYVPLGAPVFLATTRPSSNKPLKQLMFAQDTGGAIRGGVRADFFWGFGDNAGAQAGSMKQSGKMWVLLPSAYVAALQAQQAQPIPGQAPMLLSLIVNATPTTPTTAATPTTTTTNANAPAAMPASAPLTPTPTPPAKQ